MLDTLKPIDAPSLSTASSSSGRLLSCWRWHIPGTIAPRRVGAAGGKHYPCRSGIHPGLHQPCPGVIVVAAAVGGNVVEVRDRLSLAWALKTLETTLEPLFAASLPLPSILVQQR